MLAPRFRVGANGAQQMLVAYIGQTRRESSPALPVRAMICELSHSLASAPGRTFRLLPQAREEAAADWHRYARRRGRFDMQFRPEPNVRSAPQFDARFTSERQFQHSPIANPNI